MFPFKTGGELYVFNSEKPQRLLASVVKNPHSATVAPGFIMVNCVLTFAQVLIHKYANGVTLDGYYSKDAEILYNAIIKVKQQRRIF